MEYCNGVRSLHPYNLRHQDLFRILCDDAPTSPLGLSRKRSHLYHADGTGWDTAPRRLQDDEVGQTDDRAPRRGAGVGHQESPYIIENIESWQG